MTVWLGPSPTECESYWDKCFCFCCCCPITVYLTISLYSAFHCIKCYMIKDWWPNSFLLPTTNCRYFGAHDEKYLQLCNNPMHMGRSMIWLCATKMKFWHGNLKLVSFVKVFFLGLIQEAWLLYLGGILFQGRALNQIWRCYKTPWWMLWNKSP